jgi:predicted RNase H-like nuclease (RuvC/YqgF family)
VIKLKSQIKWFEREAIYLADQLKEYKSKNHLLKSKCDTYKEENKYLA